MEPQTFNGESEWDSFVFQQDRLTRRYKWSRREQKERLLDSLRGKTLDFARELSHEYYELLCRKLSKRFSKKEAPISARRQLQLVRQKENESLAELSQRVHFLAMDGLPGALEETIDQIAVETFLRACRDKEAANIVMDKNPKSVYKALQYVKEAVNNRKGLYGSKPGFVTRQVTFAEDEIEGSTRDYRVRKVDSSQGQSTEIKELVSLVKI